MVPSSEVRAYRDAPPPDTVTVAPSESVACIPTTECAGCARLRAWEKTAYQRGFALGALSNEAIALKATNALAAEQQEHLKTNREMTEALMAAEEKIAQLEQAAEALLARLEPY